MRDDITYWYCTALNRCWQEAEKKHEASCTEFLCKSALRGNVAEIGYGGGYMRLLIKKYLLFHISLWRKTNTQFH